MTPRFVERYLITFNRYSWLAAASFVLCLGFSIVKAFQTDSLPKYIGVGALTSQRPPVAFSNTAGQIQELGKQLSVELLLADNVIKAVADRVKKNPKEIRQHALIKPPNPQNPDRLQVLYGDDDPKQAAATVGLLMEAMVQQSYLINTSRLKGVVEAINKRLSQVTKELKAAEKKLNEYNEENLPERSRLQQQVAIAKALSEKAQAALADARAAEAEIVSSLAIAQPPQVIRETRFNPFFTTLGMGVLGGILVSCGLILLLTLIVKQPNQAEFRRKLLAAYRRCAITGCEVEDALEAVQIQPATGAEANKLSNGLILRADLQKLFKAQLLAIDPSTLTVRIAPALATSSYRDLAGKRVQLPEDEASRPSIEALESRYRRFRWIDGVVETEDKA